MIKRYLTSIIYNRRDSKKSEIYTLRRQIIRLSRKVNSIENKLAELEEASDQNDLAIQLLQELQDFD
jgi:predicted translin family RNA/ssDNA-binding protein